MKWDISSWLFDILDVIFHGWVISFSADNFNKSYIFQSLNHVEVTLKPQFLIKSNYCTNKWIWDSCIFSSIKPKHDMPLFVYFCVFPILTCIYLFCAKNCSEYKRKSPQNRYFKVANSSLSELVAHFQILRRLMKGKFDTYVLWSLAKKFQNWIEAGLLLATLR